MKVIFAGMPEFAAQALAALIAAGHEVVQVLTQPDRPAGRGMKLTPSPVKVLAEQHGIAVYQPEKLRTAEQQAGLVPADVMVVAAYGIILPQSVLDWPRFGCLNIHASLLPRWRGAAPIQRAIVAGDAQTGVTIMQMDAGLDTGDMLSVHPVPIADSDTTSVLHDKLAQCGADAIVAALANLAALQAQREPQPAEGVTYAEKIRKEEALLDWSLPARQLDRLVRAWNPFPAGQAILGDETLKIWQACPVAGQGEPGEVLRLEADGPVVACGEGALLLTQMQRPGGKRLPARDVVASLKLTPGARFARNMPTAG